MTIVKIRNQQQGDKLTKQNTDQASKTADQTTLAAQGVADSSKKHTEAIGAIQGSGPLATQNLNNCSAATITTNGHQTILNDAIKKQGSMTSLKKRIKSGQNHNPAS